MEVATLVSSYGHAIESPITVGRAHNPFWLTHKPPWSLTVSPQYTILSFMDLHAGLCYSLRKWQQLILYLIGFIMYGNAVGCPITLGRAHRQLWKNRSHHGVWLHVPSTQSFFSAWICMLAGARVYKTGSNPFWSLSMLSKKMLWTIRSPLAEHIVKLWLTHMPPWSLTVCHQ